MPPRRVRVLLADDHTVVREGLKAMVGGHPGFEVVGEVADGPAALALAESLDPDVVVVDVSMPGMCGAEVTARLRQARPDRKVVTLTAHEDRAYLRALLTAGATGYVLKRSAANELLAAIKTVAGGGLYVDAALASQVAAPEVEPAGLSDREAEVVRLVAGGYSNKEIAAELAVSVKTVETYKARAMEKLKVRTRVGLVRYAVGQGWLADPPAA
jgi:DNA-binding NarL/FixJ family response regulator